LGPEGDDMASGGRVPLDEGGISSSRIGMIFGGGIFKTIIKNLAKSRGINPSEYLKITNYKSLPNNVKKIISKAEYDKMKTDRIAMFENLVEMAKSKQRFLKSIEEGKRGSPHASSIFEHLEQSFKSPVPHGVTDTQILQGEQLLKNLKTEGRPLNATGGRVPLAGGAIVKGLAALRKTILKKYKGKIDDKLLKQMLVDDDPQRIAEVMATIDQGLIMQGKGMGPETIIQTFKDAWKRKKQASGGLAGLLGE